MNATVKKRSVIVEPAVKTFVKALSSDAVRIESRRFVGA
jgi:hypothetical protein